MQRNNPADALPLLEEVRSGMRDSLPTGHWMIGVATMNVGRCLTALSRYAEAESSLLESHALLEKALGPSHDRTIQANVALAALYDAWGKPDKAAEWKVKPATSQPVTQPAASQPKA